jgi:hypothetical protein
VIVFPSTEDPWLVDPPVSDDVDPALSDDEREHPDAPVAKAVATASPVS